MSCHPAALLLAACCDAATSATAAAALPPLPRCCCAASVALPPHLPLSCLSTHNEVNEWAFIKPMTQYNNKKNYVSIQQSTKRWINEWAFIKYTMTSYNNQQEGHVSSAAEKKTMFWMADGRTIQNRIAFCLSNHTHLLH
jgi:hypothetical protein